MTIFFRTLSLRPSQNVMLRSWLTWDSISKPDAFGAGGFYLVPSNDFLSSLISKKRDDPWPLRCPFFSTAPMKRYPRRKQESNSFLTARPTFSFIWLGTYQLLYLTLPVDDYFTYASPFKKRTILCMHQPVFG